MDGVPEWVIWLAAGCATFVATLWGVKFRGGAGTPAHIEGAAIVSSQAIRDLTAEVKGLRACTERAAKAHEGTAGALTRIADIMQAEAEAARKRAEEQRRDHIEALERENDRLRRQVGGNG